MSMHGVTTLDRVETSPATRFRPVLRDGDVLASKRTARADVYTISIVSAREYKSARRYSEAIESVRVLARQLQVDGWFTCNHTHFARIVAHRPQRSPADGRGAGQNRSF